MGGIKSDLICLSPIILFGSSAEWSFVPMYPFRFASLQRQDQRGCFVLGMPESARARRVGWLLFLCRVL